VLRVYQKHYLYGVYMVILAEEMPGIGGEKAYLLLSVCLLPAGISTVQDPLPTAPRGSGSEEWRILFHTQLFWSHTDHVCSLTHVHISTAQDPPPATPRSAGGGKHACGRPLQRQRPRGRSSPYPLLRRLPPNCQQQSAPGITVSVT